MVMVIEFLTLSYASEFNIGFSIYVFIWTLKILVKGTPNGEAAHEKRLIVTKFKYVKHLLFYCSCHEIFVVKFILSIILFRFKFQIFKSRFLLK